MISQLVITNTSTITS